MYRGGRPKDPIPSLNPVHIRFLSFVADQHAVKVGQLTRLFGVDRADMERFLRELEDERWIASKQFLTGDDVWVWLRNKGYALAQRNYNRAPIHPESLAHWSAITDARLWVEENLEVVRWLSEGDLRRIYPAGPSRINMPDAAAKVAELDKKTGIKREYFIAIEAEITSKTPYLWHRKMNRYEKNYKNFEKIIYFGTPEVCKKLSTYKIAAQHPKMKILEIPSVCRQLNNPEWAIETDPHPKVPAGKKRVAVYRSLSKSHLVLLKLFFDQRAIPMDQVGEFLKIKDSPEVERLILDFVGKGLLQRAQPFPDQEIWVWLTRLGATAYLRVYDQLKKSTYNYTDPYIGGLELIRLTNMVRLEIEAKGGTWMSNRRFRTILKSMGIKGSAPLGSYELDSRRYLVDVFTSRIHFRTLKKRLDQRFSVLRKVGSNENDRIVWYYSNNSRSSLTKFHKEIWPWLIQKYGEEASLKLQLRPLPNFKSKPTALSVPLGRTSGERSSFISIWRRVMRRPASEMFSVAVESLPPEAIEMVAKAAGAQHQPKIIGAWQRCRPRMKMYLLETDVGVFRVSYSPTKGWRADESINDDWYVKVELESARSVTSAAGKKSLIPLAQHVREPREFIVDAVLWAELEPLIQSIQHRLTDRYPISDRAILSGVIWRLRNESQWSNVPAELGFGSATTITKRLRDWEELGAWEDVQRILEAKLPDGKSLNWPRLARVKDRPLSLVTHLKPHQVALLAELTQNPDREYTFESYAAAYGRCSTVAASDLSGLAELNLLIGTRFGASVFSFKAAPDLAPRLEQLKLVL